MNKENIHEDGKKFLLDHQVGVLSTQHSFEDNTYPYGSMCPYAIDEKGRIVILISSIALHTKNILKDPHVGFTVFDRDEHNQQAAGRISVIGQAEMVFDEPEVASTKEIYERFYPDSKSYHQTHDFAFYRINPKKVHFIQTFGRIFTFAGEHLLNEKPWSNESTRGAIEHMNEDHQNAIIGYCHHYLGISPKTPARLMTIYPSGFHVQVNDQIRFIGFHRPVDNPAQLRHIFVEMVKECRKPNLSEAEA